MDGAYRMAVGGAISRGRTGPEIVEGSRASAARAAVRMILGDVPEGDLVELTVRGGRLGKGKWRTVAAPLDEVLAEGGGLEAAWTASRAGADAYLGMCSLTEAPPAGRRGGRGLRGTAGCLWLDADLEAPGRSGKGWESADEAFAAGMEAAVGLWGEGTRECLLAIHSGWGVQMFLLLDGRIGAVQAAALSNEWSRAVGALGGGKADKVGDPARLMRLAGSTNWRGGPDVERPVEVLAWPPVDGARLTAPEGAGRVIGGGWTGGEWTGTAIGKGGSGGALLDWDALAHQMWTWAEILEPAGLVCLGSNGREIEVWVRSERVSEYVGTGTRSAVVYGDAPDLITIFSDAIPGLEGRGGAVLGKWRVMKEMKSPLLEGDAWKAAEAEELALAKRIVSASVDLSWEAGAGAVWALGELEERRADALAPAERNP